MRAITSLPKGGEPAARGALAGLRVLVVEDGRDLREVFAALLADDGATVAQAGTGREAIALASTRPFDVVLGRAVRVG